MASPSKANWTPVLPYRPRSSWTGPTRFGPIWSLYERQAGLRQIRIIDLASGAEHLVPFPEPVYTVRTHENPEFETTLLRFTYTSLVTPSSVVEYDMARAHLDSPQADRGARRLRSGALPERAGLRHRRPTASRSRSRWYTGPPRSNATSPPLLLNGYGAYGLSYDPAFSSNTLSLLDRGFVVAIAHVRGGEEMGRPGTKGASCSTSATPSPTSSPAPSTWSAEGYTSPDRLVINGGSAGGLLMGAVTNLRPDLFRVVLAEVPFVDVVNTMLDAVAAAHRHRVRRVGQSE